MAPGEMEHVTIPGVLLKDLGDLPLTVSIEEEVQ